MLKIILSISLIGSVSNAADYVIGVTPVANSVGDTQVSSISNSKIIGLGSLALKSIITDSDIVDDSLSISKILNLQSSLNSKADQSSVNSSLALKADSSSLGSLATKSVVTNDEILDGTLNISKIFSLQTLLDSKLDSVSANSALALKADISSLGSLATKSVVTNTEISDNSLSISKINNLQTSLDTKVNSTSLGALALKSIVTDTDISDESLSITKISNLQTILSSKADQSSVASSLALKADSASVNSSLALKADQSSVNSALALKADISSLGSLATKSVVTNTEILDDTIGISKIFTLQTILDSKANNSSLALKADQSSVTASLALKADSSSLGLLATKSTVTNAEIIDGALAISKISSLQSTLDSKADQSSVTSSLALKADLSSLGSLATKSTVTNTEVADGALNISKILNLQTSLNSKADTSSLGSLATLNSIGDAQVSSISNSKITGLGPFATASSLSASDIPSILSSKISDFASAVASQVASSLSNYLLKTDLKKDNLIINGSFILNQRGFPGGFAAGNTYTYDRWRTSPTGGSFLVSFNGSTNQAIISSGSIRQTVENLSVLGGSYTLNWTGTAQCSLQIGRMPNPVYNTSPITISSVPANSELTVECHSGTLSLVQLSSGSDASQFSLAGKNIQGEIALSHRYYEKSYDFTTAPGSITNNGTYVAFENSAMYISGGIRFKTTMRDIPTVTIYNPVTGSIGSARGISGGLSGANLTLSAQNAGDSGFSFYALVSVTDYYAFHYTADAELYDFNL